MGGGETRVSNGVEVDYEILKAQCSHFGGQLASPKNVAENNAVTQMVARRGKHVYLGMNDMEMEDAFKHLNGEDMEYANWASGEPNGSMQENCIEVNLDGRWSDKSCADIN